MDTVKLHPRQWAWQFLRRNPDYRKAYTAYVSLTPAQKALAEYITTGEADGFDPDHFEPLPDSMVEISFRVDSLEHEHVVFQAVADGARGLHVDESHFSKFKFKVIRNFSRAHYGISEWRDPNSRDNLSNSEAEQLWDLEVPHMARLGKVNVALVDILAQTGNAHVKGMHELEPTKREGVWKIPNTDFLVAEDYSVFLLSEVDDREVSDLADTEVRVDFDLAKPIEWQINLIRNMLLHRRQHLVLSGLIKKARKHAVGRESVYSRYLELLDKLEHVGSASGVAKNLVDPDDEDYLEKINKCQDAIAAAIELRQSGYLALAFSEFVYTKDEELSNRENR